MSFKKPLGDLMARVPGSLGAILTDWEGEAVDQVARMDAYQLKVIGAHKGVILTSLRKALGRLGEDDLQEIVINTDRTQTLVLPVTSEYFLVLTLERGEFLGRALFEARRCVTRLKEEIA